MQDPSISRKILCVDDERRLLDGIRRQLRKEFSITTAESANEGLQVLADEGPFALVISDYNMPGVNGIEFLNQVHALYPNTVLAMLTGRAELDIAIQALHKGHISHFLNKPCPKELLSQAIIDSLEQYRLIMSEKQLRVELEQANTQLNALNQHLEAMVSARTEALATQYRFVSALTEQESSGQVAGLFTNAVKKLARTEQIALYLSSEYDESIFLPYGMPTLPKLTSVYLQQGIIASCLQTKQAIIVKQGEPLSDLDRDIFVGMPQACIPLETEKRVTGLLTIGGAHYTALDTTVIDAIKTLADTTATALMNHRHLEARSEAQDAIISALAKLSESKDPETGAHLLRLKKYCELICNILARTDKYKDIVTQKFTDDLVRSSPLHDIGKVGIPDAILKKAGKLTEAEFDVMKTHAAIGGDTLRTIFERYKSQTFIKSGMEVAYCHHEKWDGSGYPRNLKGDAIPLTARILAVADVYDALTMRRVYKAAFSREKAKEIIETGSGKHFDPDVVAAFVANEPLFNDIAVSMADAVS